MGLGEWLYQLIFMPLQLVFEEVYYIIGFKLTRDPGLAIIVLSLTINFLVLPLYNRADAVQEAQRQIEEKLRRGVEHIKKTFKGDEQLMMLQTYYRQNNYNPLDAFKNSISLFLEIPFFVAAYQFLSHLPLLKGASFGPIQDLGAADGLLTLAGVTVNVLPIIMTLVNLLAVFFFVKGAALRTKIQLYALAFFFLVFLYSSPAGLVFYWTLNNLFNLVKTIVYKIWPLQPLAVTGNANQGSSKPFWAGAVFMSLLTGLLIPSSVISASPQEFMVFGYLENPLWYLVASLSLAAGSFVLWLGVFYWLSPLASRRRFEQFLGTFGVVAVVTYLFWGANSSILSNTLVVKNGMQITHSAKAVNTGVVLLIAVGMYCLWRKFGERYRRYLVETLVAGSLVTLCMGAVNIYEITKSLGMVKKSTAAVANGDEHKIVLSRKGKNVIVFMLDGAIGSYVPYLVQEKPELKEKFAGFTCYPNTISYGGNTLFASPVLFGGYEYTPEKMNRRSNKLLREKHNEAMLLLPVLFERAGYRATVANLPLVNYQWISDYTPFKEYSNIRIENFGQPLHQVATKEDNLGLIKQNKRNFYCYGFMKSLPVLIQKNFYCSGTYANLLQRKQQNRSRLKAVGKQNGSFSDYQALGELAERTKIVATGDTYLAAVNDLTHDPVLLQQPDYLPRYEVDNTPYADLDGETYVVAGKRLAMKDANQVAVYHANMAAWLQLGRWFDFLRAQGVYDNTRIIIVADHGHGTGQIASMRGVVDAMGYNPLLLVKDFYAGEFKFDEQFMTNGDVPALAVQGLMEKPQNPFTGKIISSDGKHGKQYVISSNKYELRYNTGYAYQSCRWYSVKGDMRQKENWQLEQKDAVLP